MKCLSRPGNRGWLAGALLVMAAPGCLLADPAANATAPLPAATGPIAEQLARELAAELARAGAGEVAAGDTARSRAAPGPVLADEAPQWLPSGNEPPQDPLLAYEMHLGKPATGWRLNYDRYWEEVTFSWRIGF